MPVVRRWFRCTEAFKFFRKLASCLSGIEASAEAHYWRAFGDFRVEGIVRPRTYGASYVTRGMTDAADAAAICGAVAPQKMRHVAVEAEERNAALMLHKTRGILVRQRTMLLDALRAPVDESVLVNAQGRTGARAVLPMVFEAQAPITTYAQPALHVILTQPLVREIEQLENRFSSAIATMRSASTLQPSRHRLYCGISYSGASARRIDRQFPAWLGLTPRPQSPSAITKQATDTFGASSCTALNRSCAPPGRTMRSSHG